MKWHGALIVGLVLLLMLPGPALASMAEQPSSEPETLDFAQTADVRETFRLEGPDRVATSIAVSDHLWNQADRTAVVVAQADNFPDALAGGALAARLSVPLVLTPRGGLDARVADAIFRYIGDRETPSS